MPPPAPSAAPSEPPTEVSIVGTRVARTPGSAHVITSKQLERQEYDDAGEIERVHAELASRGYRGWGDVQVTLGTWRPWQRTPTWGSQRG